LNVDKYRNKNNKVGLENKGGEISKNNDKLIKTLKKYSKQMLCTNKFIDDAKNMNLTGRMGHKAKLVMDFILSSTIQSLSRNKSKICGFVYMIDKKDNPPNPCLSSPCQNGGTCINHGTQCSCNCEINFSGPTCQNCN
jgi:hypothetical protein